MATFAFKPKIEAGKFQEFLNPFLFLSASPTRKVAQLHCCCCTIFSAEKSASCPLLGGGMGSFNELPHRPFLQLTSPSHTLTHIHTRSPILSRRAPTTRDFVVLARSYQREQSFPPDFSVYVCVSHQRTFTRSSLRAINRTHQHKRSFSRNIFLVWWVFHRNSPLAPFSHPPNSRCKCGSEVFPACARMCHMCLSAWVCNTFRHRPLSLSVMYLHTTELKSGELVSLCRLRLPSSLFPRSHKHTHTIESAYTQLHTVKSGKSDRYSLFQRLLELSKKICQNWDTVGAAN